MGPAWSAATAGVSASARSTARICVPCAARQLHVRSFAASSRLARPKEEDQEKVETSEDASWPLDENNVEEIEPVIGPYSGLLDGQDAFATVKSPLSPTRFSPSPSGSADRLDSLSKPSQSSAKQRGAQKHWVTPYDDVDAQGRSKSLVPRSVLFADSNADRSSRAQNRSLPQTDDEMDADYLQSKTPNRRKDYDRTPLTQQEANAFMSLLNQALGGPSPSSTSTPSSVPASAAGADLPQADSTTPFGSYTSLVSDSSTETGSRNLLQAFASRNRLQRFQAARSARAKRFAHEGLAAQISHAELEAGIDEAREEFSLCDNLADLMSLARREVWGLSSTADNTVAPQEPKYGHATPFYAPVLHLLFLTIRDRYRAPNTALSVPRITKSLGIQSYVLGMTSILYNDILKTQWDWLGDMHAVVETLKQARGTGILGSGSLSARRAERRADRQDSGSGPTRYTSAATFSQGINEDETIRETVDRITNEVRKHVLDQLASINPAYRQTSSYGTPTSANIPIFSLADASSATSADSDGMRSVDSPSSSATLAEQSTLNWAQKLLLTQAEQASKLAGQPTRLLSTPPTYPHYGQYRPDRTQGFNRYSQQYPSLRY